VWHSEAHLRALVATADTLRLPIVADEVYDGMVFQGETFTPIAAVSASVPVLSVGALSKKCLVRGQPPPRLLRRVVGSCCFLKGFRSRLRRDGVPPWLPVPSRTRGWTRWADSSVWRVVFVWRGCSRQVPGWRCGWVVAHDRHSLLADANVLEALAKLQMLTLGPCGLVQTAMPVRGFACPLSWRAVGDLRGQGVVCAARTSVTQADELSLCRSVRRLSPRSLTREAKRSERTEVEKSHAPPHMGESEVSH